MSLTLRDRVETLLALTEQCVPPDDSGHPERCICDECALNAVKTKDALHATCRLAELAPAVRREVLRGSTSEGKRSDGDGFG